MEGLVNVAACTEKATSFFRASPNLGGRLLGYEFADRAPHRWPSDKVPWSLAVGCESGDRSHCTDTRYLLVCRRCHLDMVLLLPASNADMSSHAARRCTIAYGAVALSLMRYPCGETLRLRNHSPGKTFFVTAERLEQAGSQTDVRGCIGCRSAAMVVGWLLD